MNINQLSEIVKKKILENEYIEKVEILDKSFLHKNHFSKQTGKFHIKLMINSNALKKKNKVVSNKIIYINIQYHNPKPNTFRTCEINNLYKW